MRRVKARGAAMRAGIRERARSIRIRLCTYIRECMCECMHTYIRVYEREKERGIQLSERLGAHSLKHVAHRTRPKICKRGRVTETKWLWYSPSKSPQRLKRERASVDAPRSTRKVLERDGSFDAWEGKISYLCKKQFRTTIMHKMIVYDTYYIWFMLRGYLFLQWFLYNQRIVIEIKGKKRKRKEITQLIRNK